MKRVATGVLLSVLLAAPAFASNMAFVLNLNLPPAGQNLNFVSLPYLYTPADAEALCQDLGGSVNVASVLRWDEPTSRFISYTCGSGSGSFGLTKAVSYGVRNTPFHTIASAVVGSHDDLFTVTAAPTAGSNLSWVSIPYHVAIPDLGGTAGVVDAEDLCQSIGSDTVLAVVRWNPSSSAYEAYACGSVFDTPFPVTLGSGYGLVNAPGKTISWKPPHY